MQNNDATPTGVVWTRVHAPGPRWHLQTTSLWPGYHRTECGRDWPASVAETTTIEPTEWCTECREWAEREHRPIHATIPNPTPARTTGTTQAKECEQPAPAPEPELMNADPTEDLQPQAPATEPAPAATDDQGTLF